MNGRPHQRIMPLAVMEETQTHRFEPYEHAPENPLTDVLIIGAGSGNDVDDRARRKARSTSTPSRSIRCCIGSVATITPTTRIRTRA